MRVVVALLAAAGALFAALNEVASLNRFADERLHFPAGLGWTLPGMVTVGSVAGALMWVGLRDEHHRSAGRRLNVFCAIVSAAAVGVDHASGADLPWRAAAFLAGTLVPFMATWLTHLFARVTREQPEARAPRVPRRVRLPRPRMPRLPWSEFVLPISEATEGPRVAGRWADEDPTEPEPVVEVEPVPAEPEPAVEPAAVVVEDPAPITRRTRRRQSTPDIRRHAGLKWARKNWPVSGGQIATQIGVSKAEGDRIRAIVKREMEAAS